MTAQLKDEDFAFFAMARERLASELHWKMQHLDPDFPDGLDPTRDNLWDVASNSDRSFCRACVDWLLVHRDLIEAALLANDNKIDKLVSPRE